MKLNIRIDGHAGQGPNALAKVLGSVLAKQGYYVFISRDYGSYIRGGHNANVLTLSDSQIMSNDLEADIAIFLEKNIEIKEPRKLKDNCRIIDSAVEKNMYFAGRLVKMLGLDFRILENELKKLKNFDVNLRDAKKGYADAKTEFALRSLKNKLEFMDGGVGIAEGAIASGLDVYFAYPMTPATSVMGELAERQLENNHIVIELEGEIAAINAAIGSAITGAKAMTGSSGGGFDLMTEALSFIGQAEVPLVIYLAQRVGPGTGAATYTEQADLNLALNAGHGEFPRIVLAPGDPLECQELTSQAFYFSQKYRVPALILSDKHLAESLYTIKNKPVITKSQKCISLKRFNSYNHDESGTAADNAPAIAKSAESRIKKAEEIKKEARKFKPFKLYGKSGSKNLVLFWGSTKGAVLDACKDIDVKALQILYMEPFPEEIKSELLKAKNLLIVENNSTSQLAQLIASKTCIHINKENKILKYNGRPFLTDELRMEIEKRIR
jgi:2-oxoglutarate ferredoxin oxidoreductase subunit alpha